MSNHVSLLADLDSGKNCSGEAAAAIRDLERRIEAQEAALREEAMENYNMHGRGTTIRMRYPTDHGYADAVLAEVGKQ